MNLVRVFKYSFVGLITAGIYFSLYFLFKYEIKITDFNANITAYFIAIVVQYNLQSSYTFKDVKPEKNRILKFSSVTFLGYLFSFFVTSFLVPNQLIHEVVGVILVIVILPILNMILMFMWVFYTSRQS